MNWRPTKSKIDWVEVIKFKQVNYFCSQTRKCMRLKQTIGTIGSRNNNAGTERSLMQFVSWISGTLVHSIICLQITTTKFWDNLLLRWFQLQNDPLKITECYFAVPCKFSLAGHAREKCRRGSNALAVFPCWHFLGRIKVLGCQGV